MNEKIKKILKNILVIIVCIIVECSILFSSCFLSEHIGEKIEKSFLKIKFGVMLNCRTNNSSGEFINYEHLIDDVYAFKHNENVKYAKKMEEEDFIVGYDDTIYIGEGYKMTSYFSNGSVGEYVTVDGEEVYSYEYFPNSHSVFNFILIIVLIIMFICLIVIGIELTNRKKVRKLSIVILIVLYIYLILYFIFI